MAQLEIVEQNGLLVFVPVNKVGLLGGLNVAGEVDGVARLDKKRAEVAYLRPGLNHSQLHQLAQFGLHRRYLTLVEAFWE